MEDLYEKTKERSKQIIDAGFSLTEMWECIRLKSKVYKNAINKNVTIVEPLNPRDAFYVSRKNASKLKVKNKMLRHIDICSLYPTVQYFDYYPVGHPEKSNKPEKYDKAWYGLIKSKILPPKNYITLFYSLTRQVNIHIVYEMF